MSSDERHPTRQEKDSNISFMRYAPRDGNYLLTAELVECYRNVFADEPWHEWLKCPQCSKYWGEKDKYVLASIGFRHCETPLIDFWPRNEVIADLYSEITSVASCWLTINNDKVIGFCWGYPTTVGYLETKLEIPFSAGMGWLGSDAIAYQDEVGVLAPYRGRKLAKKMFARRHDDFLLQGLQVGVVRTRQYPEPSVTFSWYTKKLDYKIIAAYPDNDPRHSGKVILSRHFSGLKELLSAK